MENLHQAIKQLLAEDYTPPSARGQATDNFPTLWEEEAILDQRILTERLAKRLSRDWVEPDGVRLIKKPPPKEDDGMEIYMKKLFIMLQDLPYIHDIVVIQDLKKYDNVVEYALTSIARERGWEEIETNIYRIK
jgi:hypothetical protein